MPEKPYSRYTRERTWGALYSQHINAGYALVPYSITSNSVAVIRCQSPEETQKLMKELAAQSEVCDKFYSSHQTPDKAPPLLARARHAVVLARSSDYYHYHLIGPVQKGLSNRPSSQPQDQDQEQPSGGAGYSEIEFALVICGLHDSYLHIPVWEMRTNKRYGPRETSVDIASDAFEQIRGTEYGHNILLGALVNGDKKALAVLRQLPKRTQRRIRSEVDDLQHKRYQGRPLAFLTDADRRKVGQKISLGLKRYHGSA